MRQRIHDPPRVSDALAFVMPASSEREELEAWAELESGRDLESRTELEAWADRMGEDFRRAWQECPTGEGMLLIALFLALRAFEAGRSVAPSGEQWGALIFRAAGYSGGSMPHRVSSAPIDRERLRRQVPFDDLLRAAGGNRDADV